MNRIQQTTGTENSSPWLWPIIAPGPSWSIPRVSLPSCLGPLLQYQTEWWYYAGYVRDADGNKYSLQFSINRFALFDSDPINQLIACMTGIGDAKIDTYYFNAAFGFAVSSNPASPSGLTILPVTDTTYDISTNPLIGSAKTHVVLTKGNAGVVNSEYELHSVATGIANGYEANLQLTDERGMILEWQSGYIGPDASDNFSASSFEFAQPRLKVTGGNLVLNGTNRIITGGTLWLDRQVLTNPPSSSIESLSLPVLNTLTSRDLFSKLSPVLKLMKALYVGSWISITLDSGLTMVCACFWQPAAEGKLQWQTGTLLGLPPEKTYGNVYFPIEDARRMRNGGSYLRGIEKGDSKSDIFDFDVNILSPDEPDASPHWKSSLANGATYSTGWWIRTGSKAQEYGIPSNMYLKALVSGCENVLPDSEIPLSAYWEGAATVYADKELTQEIGYAFVEQMGFN